MNVAITSTFEKALTKLQPNEQSRIKQTVYDLMANPDLPGLRSEKLNMREERFGSIRVNQDIRIIVLREGKQQSLMYVAHHDDAYDWARRREVKAHSHTGAAQVVEFEEVIQEEVRYVQREVEAPPIFATESDEYLLSLGVPEGWLEPIKRLDEDGFFEIIDRLPEEAAEALVAIASGERPEPRPSTVDTLMADPFDHPDAKRRFWVATDSDALQQALDYPWDKWMVFLHPAQREAVERNFGGPGRVSGGAGTGKTVVALHRAVHLAKLSDNAQVLITTYSRPLVDHLEEGLNKLLGTTGDVRRRIVVRQLHAYANETACKTDGFQFVPVMPKELSDYFDKAISAHSEVDVSKEFLQAEFNAIIDFWGVKTWMDYREIQRTGRGSALSPARRKVLWPVFESVLSAMKENKKMTWADLADAARDELEKQRARPFRYVVADEVQDFGPRELQFLMALAPQSARSHFFTGDAGQRIYRYPFSWIKAGIDIRGRAMRLSVNYRTTMQIKRFADTALGDLEPGAEAEDSEDRTAISLLSGPAPTVVCADSEQDDVIQLQEWLETLLDSGMHPSEIAILARTHHLLENRAAVAIEAIGKKVAVIGRKDTANSDRDAIAIGTFHSSKGLEYRAVGLIGCSSDMLPNPSALRAADDTEGEAVAVARERQLFYVGCTRARDVLRVSYVGEPTQFLSELV